MKKLILAFTVAAAVMLSTAAPALANGAITTTQQVNQTVCTPIEIWEWTVCDTIKGTTHSTLLPNGTLVLGWNLTYINTATDLSGAVVHYYATAETVQTIARDETMKLITQHIRRDANYGGVDYCTSLEIQQQVGEELAFSISRYIGKCTEGE